MKIKFLFAVVLAVVLSLNVSYAQRVGFINSKTIREKFPEAQQAQQRVQSMTDEWKRELDAMQLRIDNLEFEIKKNRLVWTETERIAKENELLAQKKAREDNARQIFEPKGKYDVAVKTVFTAVEEKIFAAVQQVASDKGFDVILDQSIQPLPYVNYKYDLTVNVLKTLGVEVEELEKELQDKIDKDPRNVEKESKTPRKRSRDKNATDNQGAEDRKFEQPDGNNQSPNKDIDTTGLKRMSIPPAPRK
jgi:outer membrane protein